ncbi:MAG TPA: GAF domain-containing protein [Stellaceae bacterium]
MKPEEIVDRIREAVGAEMMSLQFVEGNKLRLVASYGFDKAFGDFFAVVSMDDPTSCAAAFDRKAQIFAADIFASPFFSGEPLEVLRAAGVRSVISTPLMSRGDEQLGILSIHRSTVWHITSAELKQITQLCQQISLSLSAKSRAPA